MHDCYKKINLIRLISCVAVLLYHLNILKGGYLAVCTFFVLSGYLACASAFKKEKFSFRAYYINKLKKLYFPLLIVIFVTIAVISMFPSIFWMNLKPETTSVLLGYNNFWQLGANLDYFTRQVSSPFMHLWYIAILIQFDLVFPLIFVGLRKIGEKISKFIPCFLTIILSITFCVYFYLISISENIMIAYYDTFARIFSLFLGVALGFIFNYYQDKIKNVFKNILINKILFYLNLAILIVLFIFGNSTSSNFAIFMISASLISCVLINCATIIPNKKISIFDKIVSFLSSISYEIYLFQYPVIFLFQQVNIDKTLKIFLVIIITIMLSFVLHFCLSIKKGKNNVAKYILLVLFVIISSYGIYKYVITKDYTNDMKKIEEELAKNEQILQAKQEEYLKNAQKEEEQWLSILSNLETGEEELKKIVANLPLVGIGDSIMLGAVNDLYNQFPNAYFDAQTSRTAYVATGIINQLKSKNMFGDPIVLNLGANGDCSEKCKKQLMEECKNHKVFWLTVTNDRNVGVNKRLFALAKEYDNLYIIDWETISKGHPEYFLSDRIHLNYTGRKAFTKAIYDSIYEIYLEEYNTKKEAIIKEHDEKEKTKITFYGNTILLNVYDYIKDDYQFAKFDINKEYNYEMLNETIKKSFENNTINHRLVFVFNRESNITVEEYKKLFDLCKGKEIYLISTDSKIVESLSNNSNVKVIDFAKIISENKDYVFVDGIHLSNKGNIELKNILNIALNLN